MKTKKTTTKKFRVRFGIVRDAFLHCPATQERAQAAIDSEEEQKQRRLVARARRSRDQLIARIPHLTGAAQLAAIQQVRNLNKVIRSW